MEKVIDFIGKEAYYDDGCQHIYGVGEEGKLQKLADLRGWGAIQNLFKTDSGSIDEEKAANFQDELGRWLVAAINEKLARERTTKQVCTIGGPCKVNKETMIWKIGYYNTEADRMKGIVTFDEFDDFEEAKDFTIMKIGNKMGAVELIHPVIEKAK